MLAQLEGRLFPTFSPSTFTDLWRLIVIPRVRREVLDPTPETVDCAVSVLRSKDRPHLTGLLSTLEGVAVEN
jgi:hypothetical protein